MTAPDRGNASRLAAWRVRAAVETSDGITRGELAAELGLPLGTVTAAVSALLREGVILERTTTHPERGEQPDDTGYAPVGALAAARVTADAATNGAPAERTGDGSAGRAGGKAASRAAGRPPVLLVPAGPARTVGAVIWTHGRFQTAVSTYGGTVIERAEFDVDADTSRPDVLDPAWEFLKRPVTRADRDFAPLDRVVIGVPAPFQRGVGMSPVRLPVPRVVAQEAAAADGSAPIGGGKPGFAPWLRTDPAGPLGERLGLPVIIENDANLGALGEALAGAGRGHRSVVYLKLGERSVGAGLVFDGALYRGASGYAGEIAHVHVDDDGPLCLCGSRGCLANRAREPLQELMRSAYDRPLSFEEVLRLAAADEPGPARVLRDLGRTLGRPLADLCTFLDPGVVVVDGALGAAGRHVLAGLAEQIERYAAPAVAASVRLESGLLGTEADVVGAVRLARAEVLSGRGQ